MVVRTLICSEKDREGISYRREELLVVVYKDKMNFDKGLPRPFLFFTDYSARNHVKILLYVTVFWRRWSSYIFVIEEGKTKCVSGSAAEGARYRTVEDGIGLCVGEDFIDPRNFTLLTADPHLIVALSDGKTDEKNVKMMFACKNVCPIPVLVGLSDGFYWIDDKIHCLTEGACVRLECKKRGTPPIKGYNLVRVIGTEKDI